MEYAEAHRIPKFLQQAPTFQKQTHESHASFQNPPTKNLQKTTSAWSNFTSPLPGKPAQISTKCEQEILPLP